MEKIQRILTKLIFYISSAMAAVYVVACFNHWTTVRVVIFGNLVSAVIIVILAKIAIYEVESRV